MNGSSDPRELTSWKEIAEYLGVTVRTAQHWERERGLPVLRTSGSRAAVSSRIADLEAWRRSSASNPRPKPGRLRRTWMAAAALLLAAGLVVVWRSKPAPSPAGWRVSGDTFITTDAGGSELWRYRYPAELKESTMRANRDFVQFVDLDGDGTSEVLVNADFAERRQSDGSLICFSSTGRLLWRFVPGREVRTRKETFSPPHAIEAVRLLPRMRDGRQLLLVSGHHSLYYPAQVALLDTEGNLVSEYWHSGNLNHVAFADIDHDGAPEILLGGISNSWRAATLVCLRLKDVAGASQEANPDYQLLGFAPAHETARLLFRRTDLNSQLNPYNYVNRVKPMEDAFDLDVGEAPPAGADLRYRLNWRFEVQDIVPAPGFPAEHDRLFAQHLLDHRFDPHRDLDPLRDVVYIRRP